jgi:hypothetical protein
MLDILLYSRSGGATNPTIPKIGHNSKKRNIPATSILLNDGWKYLSTSNTVEAKTIETTAQIIT